MCPWNRKAPPGRLAEFEPQLEWVDPDLIPWLNRERSSWPAKLKGTALARTKRVGLLRNAALVLGTRRVPEAVSPLAARLDDLEEEPIVRASAAWALGRIAGDAALAALDRHQDDPDPVVRESVLNARLGGAAPGHEKGRADELGSPARHLPAQELSLRPARTCDDPAAVDPPFSSPS